MPVQDPRIVRARFVQTGCDDVGAAPQGEIARFAVGHSGAVAGKSDQGENLIGTVLLAGERGGASIVIDEHALTDRVRSGPGIVRQAELCEEVRPRRRVGHPLGRVVPPCLDAVIRVAVIAHEDQDAALLDPPGQRTVHLGSHWLHALVRHEEDPVGFERGGQGRVLELNRFGRDSLHDQRQCESVERAEVGIGRVGPSSLEHHRVGYDDTDLPGAAVPGDVFLVHVAERVDHGGELGGVGRRDRLSRHALAPPALARSTVG